MCKQQVLGADRSHLHFPEHLHENGVPGRHFTAIANARTITHPESIANAFTDTVFRRNDNSS
jgi:hypothetical protein